MHYGSIITKAVSNRVAPDAAVKAPRVAGNTPAAETFVATAYLGKLALAFISAASFVPADVEILICAVLPSDVCAQKYVPGERVTGVIEVVTTAMLFTLIAPESTYFVFPSDEYIPKPACFPIAFPTTLIETLLI